MRSKVASLQVGNFQLCKSWRFESERFTCLRERGRDYGRRTIVWRTCGLDTANVLHILFEYQNLNIEIEVLKI